jgi:urease accessory protein
VRQAAPLLDADLQRARGTARVVLGGSAAGTRVVDLFQQSPLRVMFPDRPGMSSKEAVLINTGGGVAGGDRLEVSVSALEGASCTVTTQAAERVYRALSEPARVHTRLQVGAAATLAWLPQETLVFNRARLRRKTEIEISSASRLLALEWLVLGRTAHGEEVLEGQITEHWSVKRDGRLVWADTFRLADPGFADLRRKSLLADCRSVATLIHYGPALDEHIGLIRELAASMACPCAATVVAGLLVTRLAARAAVDLRNGLREILRQLARVAPATSFQTPHMWSC